MASWLDRYLSCDWVRDGMEYPRLNCWGLVRLVRSEVFGLPLLPSFSIPAEDKRGLTKACGEVVSAYLAECSPADGVIAAAYRGRLCVHVGIVVDVDGRLGVLDVDETAGAGWQALRRFESKFSKVVYYHDKDLPVTASE